MSDSYGDLQQNGRNFDNPRDGGRGNFNRSRGPGSRDQGGFRIRLSDNEMRAARSLQEAFNLRSTVAVLGFALRTLAQLLEEGKLDEVLENYRAQPTRGNNRKDDAIEGSRRNKFDKEGQGSKRGAKPNPFERPPKPDQQKETESNETESSEITNEADQSIQIDSEKNISNEVEESNTEEKKQDPSENN